MSQQPEIERLQEQAKRPHRWSAYSGSPNEWPTVITKVPPEDKEVLDIIVAMCGTTTSALIRNIIHGLITDAFGRNTMAEVKDILGRIRPEVRKEFARRLWAGLTFKKETK